MAQIILHVKQKQTKYAIKLCYFNLISRYQVGDGEDARKTWNVRVAMQQATWAIKKRKEETPHEELGDV